MGSGARIGREGDDVSEEIKIGQEAHIVALTEELQEAQAKIVYLRATINQLLADRRDTDDIQESG
jgi:hypothetical protein